MRAPRSRILLAVALLATLVPGVGQAVPDELTEQLDRAEQRLAELDTKVSMAVEDYNAAAARLERLQARQATTRAHVEQLAAEVAALEDTTAAFVRMMYMRGPTTGLAVALDTDGVVEAGRSLAVADRLARQRQVQLERLGVQRAELGQARQRLARQVEAAEQRQAEVAEHRATVQQMLADQQDEVAALQDEIAEIEAREAAERAAREAARQAAARRAAAEQAAAEAAAEQAAQAAAAQAAAESAAPEGPAEPATPPPPPPEPAPTGTRSGADTAVQAALSQLGKPYEYAADGPDSYDCSGLTMWAWAQAGVSLPHSSRMQFAVTTRISREQLQPGDLVFYGAPIHHVAIYLDGTRVIEAPYTGANVRIREDGLLRDDIAGYGRV